MLVNSYMHVSHFESKTLYWHGFKFLRKYLHSSNYLRKVVQLKPSFAILPVWRGQYYLSLLLQNFILFYIFDYFLYLYFYFHASRVKQC